MEWRSFRFEYRLHTKALQNDLFQVELAKGVALGMLLPSKWKAQLDQLNRVRAVHGTTAIEGNPLSEAEVRRQLQQLEALEKREARPHGGRRAAAKARRKETPRELLQIQNAGRAQEWVRRRFAPDAPPITLDDIFRMHRLLTEASDEHTNLPGRLRRHEVTVGAKELGGVHRGAPAQRLPRLMEGFIAFVNSRQQRAQHPVVRALLAHFFLATLHPFGDGNGRVSRLVEAGLLYQAEYNVLGFYGLSNYFYRHGNEYRTLLQKSRDRRPFALDAFTAFGVKGFVAELHGIINFIKTRLNRVIYRDTMRRAFAMRESSRRRVLNQREYNLLEYLLQATEPADPFSEALSQGIAYSELVQAPYAKAVYREVSKRTLDRELTRLQQKGFIAITREGAEQFIALDAGAIAKY